MKFPFRVNERNAFTGKLPHCTSMVTGIFFFSSPFLKVWWRWQLLLLLLSGCNARAMNCWSYTVDSLRGESSGNKTFTTSTSML